MSELIPRTHDDRSYDEQMKDALEKALEIQGTVINDLQMAINCIAQMERGMKMCGVPNPHEAMAQYLKKKYRMNREETNSHTEAAQKLLVESKSELVESVDGEVVEDA